MKPPKLQSHKVIETIAELKKPLLVVALLWGVSFLILLASESAKAELRCDCTQVIDSCSATVSMNDMRVNIASNNDSCSRVDYLIDGQPFAALVVGGQSELNWPGQPLRDPRIVVENCRVCAEAGKQNTATESTSEQGNQPANEAGQDADSEMAAIVKVMPTYPREAWSNLIEGIVTVEFSVNAGGLVQNIRVVDATNQLFVTNSIDAVSRFRYKPPTTEIELAALKNIREQFVFRLLDGTDPVVSSKTL